MIAVHAVSAQRDGKLPKNRTLDQQTQSTVADVVQKPSDSGTIKQSNFETVDSVSAGCSEKRFSEPGAIRTLDDIGVLAI